MTFSTSSQTGQHPAGLICVAGLSGLLGEGCSIHGHQHVNTCRQCRVLSSACQHVSYGGQRCHMLQQFMLISFLAAR